MKRSISSGSGIMLLRVTLLILVTWSSVEAFTLPRNHGHGVKDSPTSIISVSRSRSSVALRAFGKGSDDQSETADEEPGVEKKRGFLPFFSRLVQDAKKEAAEKSDATEDNKSGNNGATTATAVVEAVEEPKKDPTPAKPQKVEETPEDVAKSLRDQAMRARLEAERMDAELTLSKIERLETQLARAKAKGESVDDLQLQMNNLQAKLRGEDPAPVVVPKTTPKPPTIVAASEDLERSFASTVELSRKTLTADDLLSGEDLEEIKKNFEEGPGFIKKIVATMVEMEYNDASDINSTELALRTVMMKNGDFSYSSLPKPKFTKEEIEAASKAIEESSWGAPYVSAEMEKLADGNKTLLALYGLEHDYYTGSKLGNDADALKELSKIAEGEDWLKGIIDAANQTAVDRSIETLYPKCTRKEGGEPTMAQVQMFMSSVLPKANFVAAGQAEQVLGGYVIRGNHKYENGDDLIAAIDKAIATTSLGDKMTVLYCNDFTVFAKAEEDDIDFETLLSDQPPILYVMGADICRERKRVALSVTSAFGLATSWYLAIYPFLLNPTLSKKIEEQLGLAEAGLPYDLDWLTDLSVPLFLTFIGIQLSHELAHRLVAGLYNMKVSIPTFVPSLITGTTSTVTTFQEPPPSKDAMFDFAAAGPLVGLLASVSAVYFGSQLTLVSDPATLPGLPLEILRQSTLGGGIINGILGNGALSVPDGALGTSAVAGMVIPLHPIAIAGYVSLFVNALSLLPIGTTDGGRMAQTLFGRGSKLVIGNMFMLALLIAGLLGSDLFLFYFAFVSAFQTGNEIPARNEADNLDFSRGLASVIAYVLAFLVLVPFQ